MRVRPSSEILSPPEATSFPVWPTYRASAAPATPKSRPDVWASKTAALASEASIWAASHHVRVGASCKRWLGGLHSVTARPELCEALPGRHDEEQFREGSSVPEPTSEGRH